MERNARIFFEVTMSDIGQDTIRQAVLENYTAVAKREGGSGCGPEATGCCGGGTVSISNQIGYSEDELASVPAGADMGLGCGNPQAIAALRPGETVLDLGSGGGFDCFLAARQVGETGRVIGVDMTPEMVRKARANSQKGGYTNVEFRLGEIEHLPVADRSVDAIISNCVINLSPDKASVFREAFRVLKPGGRLAVADIVATAALPEDARQDLALISGCVGGAAPMDEIETFLREAGFRDIRIQPKDASRDFIREWAPGRRAEDYVVSASIGAVKPSP
jgi:SAM-dependent methyltransferase